MALTWSEESNASSAASSATLVTSANVDASVGDLLLALISADNAGTSGANSISSVSDSVGGNTWQQRAIINADPGNANAGITYGVYSCIVSNLLSSATVTVNFSPNTTAKVVNIRRAVPGGGEAVQFVAVDTTGTVNAANTTLAAPTANVTNGDTIVAGGAYELGTTTPTGDSDTTNGSWSPIANYGNGTVGSSGASVCSQIKTVNATGNQNWSVTLSGNTDSAGTYIIYRAVASSSTPLTQAYILGSIGAWISLSGLSLPMLGKVSSTARSAPLVDSRGRLLSSSRRGSMVERWASTGIKSPTSPIRLRSRGSLLRPMAL